MLKYYTYLWLRWDGTPYYVGKGAGQRAFFTGWHKVSCPKDKSRILVEYHLSEQDAYEAEKFLISFYGREDLGTGRLLNKTNGGEGGNTTGGKPLSFEHREKIRIALLGIKRPYMIERNKSEQMRIACRKKRPWSNESKQRLSSARKGKHFPNIAISQREVIKTRKRDSLGRLMKNA